jgi:molybdate transport system substrate-binding protein
MRRRLGVALPAILALLAPLVSRAAVPAGAPTTLRVFAAASLARPFADLAKAFEAAHAGCHVEYVFAGSQQLVAQLQQGAAGDVLATADTHTMDGAHEAGLLAGEAATFVRNRLVLIVPASNPARIRSWRDLGRRGIKLVIGADAVPVGHYAREVLLRLSKQSGAGDDWLRRANASVVSEEENVKAVLAKVQLGEADAGFVYRSDVAPSLARYVKLVAFPDDANVIATYSIATLAHAQQPELAKAFTEWIVTSEAQGVLTRNGFLPAQPAP